MERKTHATNSKDATFELSENRKQMATVIAEEIFEVVEKSLQLLGFSLFLMILGY